MKPILYHGKIAVAMDSAVAVLFKQTLRARLHETAQHATA